MQKFRGLFGFAIHLVNTGLFACLWFASLYTDNPGVTSGVQVMLLFWMSANLVWLLWVPVRYEQA